jgi:nickel/cobalt transporter (NicO) family protein
MGLRALAIVAFLLMLLSGQGAARADALTGGRAAPEAAAGGGVSIGGSVVMRLAALQRQLNERISAAFREVRDRQSSAALALILGLSFLYGVLHAVGPGHGKAVVASYFVANRARWTGGIVMGSLISLIQGLSAIVLVGLLAVILEWRQFDVLNRTTLVEVVSYGLIAALGVGMLYRAITGKGHAHGHGPAHDGHDHPPSGPVAALDRRLIIATGLTPCASAIIILLFALANESLGVGIAAVASLSLGMAVTVSAIGVASVLGRHVLLGVVDRVGIQSHRLEQGLSLAGALVIVVVSSLMMVGAWTRL